MQKDPKKVFISYRHDSDEHSDRVLSLADQLREDGVDCWIDQYEEGLPENDWPLWMEKQVEESLFTLVICTETYHRRFYRKEEPGKGKGVTWEGAIITNMIYDTHCNNTQFVPVVFSKNDLDKIPLILKGTTHYILNENYENLLRLITRQHKTKAKPLGKLKSLPPKSRQTLFLSIKPFNVPLHRNTYFTGREDILKQLRENLEAGKQTALTQALSGLGGVGKTQIAAEYAHRYKNSYEAVFWVDAESNASLDNSVVDIARLLDLPEKDRPERSIVQQAVQKWLASQTNWLLVLDNIEDINLYKNFIPTSAQGHIVITTRLQSTPNVRKLEINEMKEDGVLFLLRRSGAINDDQESENAKPDDLKSAKKINEVFGGLALALEQAGAYVEENGISLVEYLELYESSGSELLSEQVDAGDYPEPVARAFDISLKKTKENSPAAYELIQLCAFYDPDSIPELIFKEGQEHLGKDLKSALSEYKNSDISENLFSKVKNLIFSYFNKSVVNDLKWKKVVKEACRFSLLQRNASEESFRMHRLIQQAVRDGQANSKEIALKAFKVLSVPFPHPNTDNFETWGLCRNLLPCFLAIQEWTKNWHLESVEIAGLYNSAGTFFQYVQGEYQKAEPLYLADLEMSKKLLGDEHPNVAASLNNLANLYYSQGRYENAEPLYKESIKMRKKLLGDEHPSVANSLNNLAVLYDGQGRYEETEPLYKESLKMQKKLLGDEHPNVATSLNNLALLYKNQGHYEDAEPLYKDALKMRKKLLGDEHPDVATSLNNLGSLYANKGDYQNSEVYLTQALDLVVRLLGPDHPNSIMMKNNLENVRSMMKEGE